MAISNPHNLNRPATAGQRPYGIRVTLPPGDTFRELLGPDWQKYHWYASAGQRDRALAQMSRRHEYSRAQDRPSLVFEKVEKLAESRGL
jgi:hypothetical protein